MVEFTEIITTENELKTAQKDNQTLCHHLYKKYRDIALWFSSVDIVKTECGERWQEHTYIIVNHAIENELKTYIKRFAPFACVTFK